MFFLEVDPSVVKPGWTPLIITILLAAAIALLMISMRRQMRKISVPHRDEVDDSRTAEPGATAGRPTRGESDGSSESDDTSRPDQTTLGGTAGERHLIGRD